MAAILVAALALCPVAGAATTLSIPAAREKAAQFAESTCAQDQSCIRNGVLNCRRDTPHVAFCRIFLQRHTKAQGRYTCNRLIRLSMDPKTHRIPVTGLGHWHC
jgi:hypothetical protein